ncbi:MAG: NAD(P)-binding protein, partial [Syntrophales bacterium]|nr:NAD(P)-binding protein [Syntrophales bacterium]
MADAKYDAIVIGGSGGKALTAAAYLAKYGGMKVAVFEWRHEAGGGWSTEESPAPGFLGEVCASGVNEFTYAFDIIQEDFPGIREKGFRYFIPEVPVSIVDKDNNTSLCFYNELVDPDASRTCAEIARFSQRDADTYKEFFELMTKKFVPAVYRETMLGIRKPGVPSPLEKLLMDPGIIKDPSWLQMSILEFLRMTFPETPLLRGMILKATKFAHIPINYPGTFMVGLLLGYMLNTRFSFVVGGTHSLCHAIQKEILANGGKMFTSNLVSKIVVENGKAKGVMLADGSFVEAKIVVSGASPFQLCFSLLDKEVIPKDVYQKMEGMRDAHYYSPMSATWTSYASHECPKWKAAELDPNILLSGCVFMIGENYEEKELKDTGYRLYLRQPTWDTRSFYCMQYKIDKETSDPLRVPLGSGKHTFLLESNTPPFRALNEKEWLEFKKKNYEYEMKV